MPVACRAACRPQAPVQTRGTTSAAAAAGAARLVRPRRRAIAAAVAGDGSAAAAPAPRELLTPQQRSKLDASPDRDFYSQPRIVHHLDAGFRAQLTQLYRQRIPAGAAVLDLCSSWVSHLPPEAAYARVVGHGMNAAELARNPQLTEWFVRDLNEAPDGWALADASVDAVCCVAGLQYLQNAERVLAEARRVLKPGGQVFIAFSNRLFYHKAFAAWRESSDWGRVVLVKSLLLAAGFDDPIEVVRGVELPAGGSVGPLEAAKAWLFERLSWGGGSGDPFYCVIARKAED